MISVEKMFWNPTVANLTLMALGSSAPEIILSIADTMGTLGELPSELGPQAIVGSAAFNLLVISAVSIVAVKDPKHVKMVGVFLTTAIFSTWAYVWFFLVLVVISPGYVELWEALTTLAFMGILCIIAYSCDVCATKGENTTEKKMEEKRKVTKAAIRILRKKFGVRPMLEVGHGQEVQLLNKNQKMSEADVDNINEYYAILLTKDIMDLEDRAKWADPKEATVDELLECLNPENAVERIAFRKQVGNNHPQAFTRIDKGAVG